MAFNVLNCSGTLQKVTASWENANHNGIVLNQNHIIFCHFQWKT